MAGFTLWIRLYFCLGLYGLCLGAKNKLSRIGDCEFPDHVACEGSDQCVFVLQLCDGHPDCPTGSDEDRDMCEGRICPPGVTMCDDEVTCLPVSWVCDGEIDCSDGSDENEDLCDEVSSCPAHLPFDCGDGTCVPSGQVCDRYMDCPSGLDEQDCSSCDAKQFQCAHDYDTCISLQYRCDGNVDCDDYSDELGCPPPTCRSTEFQCGDRRCIPGAWQCDGEEDCADGFDELDIFCIAAPTTDDTITEQPESPSECDPHYWACNNGQCIPESYRCDKFYDCSENEDEESCIYGNVPVMPGCPREHMPCSDGGCIPASLACDGYNDCVSGEDESVAMCSQIEVPCNPGFVKCGYNLDCIMEMWICDGVIDCPDSSDEDNCPGQVTESPGPDETNEVTGASQCAPDTFPCGDGTCIPMSYVCDGSPQCQSGIDEESCVFTTQGPAPTVMVLNGCEMQEYDNMLLVGVEHQEIIDLTMSECRMACLETETCLSLDYIIGEDDTVCYLNFESHTSSPDSFYHYPGDGYHYMYKRCSESNN